MPTISSRTPEGEPNRCPLCGNDFDLEPSPGTRDAPCPSCGQLLWWFQRRLDIDDPALALDYAFVDLDSLDDVELVMALEEEFDLTISDEDAAKIRTVADAIRFIERKRREREERGE